MRSRLILTYLLFGLAPVVLGVTLVSVFAYITAGQFAIHLADTRLLAERDRMRGQNANRFDRMMQAAGISGNQQTGVKTRDLVAALPSEREGNPLDAARFPLHTQSRIFLDGVPIEYSETTSVAGAVVDGRARVPLGLPVWATSIPDGHFSGLVLDEDDLYLVAINQQVLSDHRVISLLTSFAGRCEADGPRCRRPRSYRVIRDRNGL